MPDFDLQPVVECTLYGGNLTGMGWTLCIKEEAEIEGCNPGGRQGAKTRFSDFVFTQTDAQGVKPPVFGTCNP